MSNHSHIWRPRGKAMCCLMRLSQRNCGGNGARQNTHHTMAHVNNDEEERGVSS